MSLRRKTLLVVFIIGIGMFAYTQYASASKIGVVVSNNEFLREDELGSYYNIQLEFTNPSLLILNAGETEFAINIEDKKIADGKLEPFILPSMSKIKVQGTYLEEKNENQKQEPKKVSITGVTKYDVFFTSIDVPFIYIPSDDQAREFIHQK